MSVSLWAVNASAELSRPALRAAWYLVTQGPVYMRSARKCSRLSLVGLSRAASRLFSQSVSQSVSQ